MRELPFSTDSVALKLARSHLLRWLRQNEELDLLAGRVCNLVVITQHASDLQVIEKAIDALPYYSEARTSRTIVSVQHKSKKAGGQLQRLDDQATVKQTIHLTCDKSVLPDHVIRHADAIIELTIDLDLCERLAHEFGTPHLTFTTFPVLSTFPFYTLANYITRKWSTRDIERKLCYLFPAHPATDAQSGEPDLDCLSGYGEAACWGKLLAEDLRLYREGKLSWNDIDRGILISGPPGVGKTLFARALANTCNIPLYAHSLARWQSQGSLDDLLKAMRSAFEEASKNAPAILFLDEIDSFGNRANLSGHNANYGRQVINGLLEHLDGVSNREGVFVIAATNMPDLIDPAITRSGRIEHHVSITLPEPAEREGILRFHLGRDLEGEDISDVAESLTEASGADIAKFVRQARHIARLEKRPLALSDLLRLKPTTTPLQPDDIYRIAVHEAGHTVVAHALSDSLGMVPVSVMINREVQSGTARLGGVRLRNTELKIVKLRENYEAEICSYLGGLAAEHVILGTHSDGGGGAAGSDLAKATEIAIKMEASYGLGENLSFWSAHCDCRTDWLKYNSQLRTIVDKTLRSCFIKACAIIEERTSAVLLIVGQLEGNGEVDEKTILKSLNHPIDVRGENAGSVTNMKAG